jgi:hypothetical protein
VETGESFELLGTILGIAIYNNIIVDVRFPLPVYKKLLGLRTETSDLELLDPALYKGLR